MQSTAPRSVRAFMSKIHQQLPLSTRESQRLLNLLTESFETQLDKHHPAPGLSAKSTSGDNIKALPEPTQPLAHPTSAFDTTEYHVKSLLTHPVLAGRIHLPPTPSLASSLNPLDSLRQHIADGRLTMPALRRCILAIDANYTDDHPISKAMRWTMSSGQLTPDQVFSDPKLNDRLVFRLIDEQNRNMVKSWLEVSSPDHACRARVLNRYVLHLGRSGAGVSRAVKDFLAFVQLESFQLHSLHGASRAFLKLLLRKGSSAMSETSNTALMQRIKAWSVYPDLDGAILQMYHPSLASLDPALKVILHPTGLKTRFPRASKQTLVFCLTVARQLLADGDLRQAERVLQVLSTQFADELGLEQVSRIKSAVDSQMTHRPDDDALAVLDKHLKAMLKFSFG